MEDKNGLRIPAIRIPHLHGIASARFFQILFMVSWKLTFFIERSSSPTYQRNSHDFGCFADDARRQIHQLIAACRQTRAVVDKRRDELLAKTVTLSKVKTWLHSVLSCLTQWWVTIKACYQVWGNLIWNWAWPDILCARTSLMLESMWTFWHLVMQAMQFWVDFWWLSCRQAALFT